MRDRSEVSAINGPVGSGKTTTVLMKALKLASEQAMSPRREVLGKPVRMFKLCVVRDTYRSLWRTTLPSWWKRVPRDIGEWQGGENQPCSHRVVFGVGWSVIEFIAEFVALGEHGVEEVLRGYEPTGFYLNEADLLDWDVFEYAATRWGRYPGVEDGGATWGGCLMDCNAPVIGTEFHKRVFLEPVAGLRLYRQPGGEAAGAENVENLPVGYYERMKRLVSGREYRRLVENEPGFTSAGRAVHEEFSDLVHVAADELAAVPGLALWLGFDAGLDPACVIGQKLGNGRWVILDEVVSEHGTGALRFSRMVNELLRERYGDWQASEELGWGSGRRAGRRLIRGWADPSSAWGVDRHEEEASWMEIVGYETGVRIEAAPSNDTVLRREGLRRVLTLMPDGKPAFRLSPRCVRLRAGLSGGFRYRKLAVGGALGERWTDEVEKNEFSHVCEALEYLLLGGGEGVEVTSRRARGWEVRDLPRQVSGEWGLPGEERA
jgi:hypothetical protein